MILCQRPFLIIQNDAKYLDLDVSNEFCRDRQWAQVRCMIQRNMDSIDRDIKVSFLHDTN